MSKSFKKIIGAGLAVCIVLACGLLAGDAKVKATDGEEIPEVVAAVEAPPPVVEEVVVVQEEPEYVVEAVVEVPAPVEETPAEEAAPAEEPPAEETPVEEVPAEEAAEEEVFNVEEAYRHYMTLNDAEKQAYLDSLSAENRETLRKYIEKKEAEAAAAAQAEETPAEETPVEEVLAEEPAEEVQKSIELWVAGDVNVPDGSTVTLCSRLTGYGENVTYQWVYSFDGVTWEKVPGGNESTFTFPLNETTRALWWDLIVTEG